VLKVRSTEKHLKQLPNMSTFNTFMTQAFGPALKGFAESLLTEVAKDHDLDLEVLKERYLATPEWVPTPVTAKVPRTPRVPKEKPEVQKCSGLTAKGGPCTFVAKCDGLCGIHLRKANTPPKEPKAAGEPKKKGGRKPKDVQPKAEIPQHTHGLTEEAEECVVCETQGNVMNPNLTKAEFEAVADDGKSIQDRLAAILANAEQDDDEEAEEPAESPEPMEIPEEPKEVAKPVEVVKPVEIPEEPKEAPKPVEVVKPVEIPEEPKEAPKPMEIPEEPKEVAKPKKKVMKPKKVTKPVEAPKPIIPMEIEEPEEEEDEIESMKDITSKLASLLAAEDDEEEEEEEEEEEAAMEDDDDDMKDIMSKLAKVMSAEEGEEYDETDMEQMLDTPPSRNKLEEMKRKITGKSGGYDFNALLEEDDEEEE
jgi:hypothetical protein